jgi:hypothetical protein
VAESGNLTGGIFLCSGGMSTVKIRAGSLFCTPPSRIGAADAGFGRQGKRFPEHKPGSLRQAMLSIPARRPSAKRAVIGQIGRRSRCTGALVR